jgi:hypothetical protein
VLVILPPVWRSSRCSLNLASLLWLMWLPPGLGSCSAQRPRWSSRRIFRLLMIVGPHGRDPSSSARSLVQRFNPESVYAARSPRTAVNDDGTSSFEPQSWAARAKCYSEDYGVPLSAWVYHPLSSAAVALHKSIGRGPSIQRFAATVAQWRRTCGRTTAPAARSSGMLLTG